MDDRNIIKVPAGYEALGRVLQAALDQAATGKGVERHGTGDPFDRQRTMQIARAQASAAGPLFQAHKKLHEGEHMRDPEAAVREFLGAINYVAFAVLMTEELGPKVHDLGPASAIIDTTAEDICARLCDGAKLVLTAMACHGSYERPEHPSGPIAEGLAHLRAFGLVVDLPGRKLKATPLGLVITKMIGGYE